MSDSDVDVLKGSRLNTRLLSKMICHPDFRRFLIDMEICVDRIADMRLKDMNLLLDWTRQKVMNKYHPEEDDLSLRTLELAQLNADMFYSHVLHSDLDAIVKDIRTAHGPDITTADNQTEAEAAAQDMSLLLAEALDYEGTTDGKRAFWVCRTLDIKYDRLTDEEKTVFARVCKKSPKLINVMSQRGNGMPRQGKKKRK